MPREETYTETRVIVPPCHWLALFLSMEWREYMHSITHVGVLSCGKISGLTGVIIGFVGAVPYALFATLLAGVAADSGESGAAALGIGAALGMVIVGPLVLGAVQFIAGLIYAVVLNFVLRITGGLELSVEKIS